VLVVARAREYLADREVGRRERLVGLDECRQAQVGGGVRRAQVLDPRGAVDEDHVGAVPVSAGGSGATTQPVPRIASASSRVSGSATGRGSSRPGSGALPSLVTRPSLSGVA
jgi:hypothetical protein